MNNNSRKKSVLITALVACLVLAIGGGVFAWFSADDGVTNTFTSGTGIDEPDKKPDPENPEQGGSTDVGENDQFIIEDKWENNSQITPDSIVAKNPNVGIRQNSNPAYVFVEVENNLGDGAYFILNKNWVPVHEQADPFEGVNNAYSSGLFMYIGSNMYGNPASTEADIAAMKLLEPITTPEAKDAYTGEVFSKIYTTHDFKKLKDKATIEVKAFLASKSSEKEDISTDSAKTEIYKKAIAWKSSNNTAAATQSA